ncbi:MAG TPA: hypothetical protein DIS62_03645 [Candidatus Kerfeldbacteria bacterium]|nr:hypothetical protein [Candidatus Kerfeldbacteria bacterium]
MHGARVRNATARFLRRGRLCFRVTTVHRLAAMGSARIHISMIPPGGILSIAVPRISGHATALIPISRGAFGLAGRTSLVRLSENQHFVRTFDHGEQVGHRGDRTRPAFPAAHFHQTAFACVDLTL